MTTQAPGCRPASADSWTAVALLLALAIGILWQVFSVTARYATSGTETVVVPTTGWSGSQGTRLEYRGASVRFSNTAVAGQGYLVVSPILRAPAGAVEGRATLTLWTDAGRQTVGILAGDGSYWMGQGVMRARSPGRYDVDITFTFPFWRQRGVRIVVSNAPMELGASSGSLEIDALSFRYARSLVWTRWVDGLTGSVED